MDVRVVRANEGVVARGKGALHRRAGSNKHACAASGRGAGAMLMATLGSQTMVVYSVGGSERWWMMGQDGQI